MNYTLTITEEERQTMAEAFAIMARKIGSCTPVLDAQSGTDHARALLAPPSGIPPSTSASAQNTPAVAHAPAPIMVRDRWAMDRKGKELPNPEGVTSREVTIWKVEAKKPRGKPDGSPFLKVTWQSQERGYVDANCFETTLFPWIEVARVEQRAIVLHLVRKDKYLNIVGVRA